MSLNDLIASDVDDVFLDLDDFAETFVRYAGGRDGKASTFVGIFSEGVANIEEGTGRGVRHDASIWCNSTTDIQANDSIRRGEVWWEVSRPTQPEDGGQTIYLTRIEPQRRGAKNLRNGDL
jgi:hypothetical protein